MSAAALEAGVSSLAFDSIEAGYRGMPVLRAVSLSVEPGTVVGLLGPNGAGKTTLLRVGAGLLRPTSGTVRLRGADATRQSAARRARSGVCLIPEGRGVFRSLTVKENIAVLVKARDRAKAVDKAVAAFPALGPRLDQVTGTLSGGQQQMVAMVRAYLAGADVILLDEVSMGLAPLVVDEIYENIRALARTGTSLLIVEQYVDRVLEIADIVHVLSRGGVAFSGPARSTSREELMQSYLHVTPEPSRREP